MRRVDKVVGDWSRHVVIDIVAIGIEGEVLGRAQPILKGRERDRGLGGLETELGSNPSSSALLLLDDVTICDAIRSNPFGE